MSIDATSYADALQFVAPVFVGLALVGLISALKEPARQKFSAVFLAGAGAAYLSGGFGLWEFAFCGVVTLLAFIGLSHYRALGVGWLAHSAWDVLHHLYGHPIIPFAPSSSLGCSICDPVLAVWYGFGAPGVWDRLGRRAAAVVRAEGRKT